MAADSTRYLLRSVEWSREQLNTATAAAFGPAHWAAEFFVAREEVEGSIRRDFSP